MKGLLAEQAEVSKQVVALEEERLQKSLEHMEAMVELEKEMSFLGELYPSVAATADDDGRATNAKRSRGNGEHFHLLHNFHVCHVTLMRFMTKLANTG